MKATLAILSVAACMSGCSWLGGAGAVSLTWWEELVETALADEDLKTRFGSGHGAHLEGISP